jgi:hypothetical protein
MMRSAKDDVRLSRLQIHQAVGMDLDPPPPNELPESVEKALPPGIFKI